MESIRDRVLKVVLDVFSDSLENFDDDTNLVEEIGIDSLTVVELTQLLEDEFNIDLRDESLEHFCSIKSIVSVVDSKLAR